MFDILLLYVFQLHINLLVIFHCYELLAKCLHQLFENVIWMVLNIIFSPFKDIILGSKIKQVDDASLHCFTISFNGLLEHSNVNIQISVFDIGWVLQLLVWQLGCQFWYKLHNRWLIPWWYKHVQVRCWPSKGSNRWIKRWLFRRISFG